MATKKRGRAFATALLVASGLVATLGAGGAPAGAGTVTPCEISVSPTTLPPGGGDVTVTGHTKANVTLTVYVNGTPVTKVKTDGNGNFSVVVRITQTSNIAVSSNDDDYPIACDPLVQIIVGGAGVGAAGAAGALAGTGSSNTVSIVLVGLALAAVGAIFIVAANRHRSVSNRL